MTQRNAVALVAIPAAVAITLYGTGFSLDFALTMAMVLAAVIYRAQV